jgi:hypothetical protein
MLKTTQILVVVEFLLLVWEVRIMQGRAAN